MSLNRGLLAWCQIWNRLRCNLDSCLRCSRGVGIIAAPRLFQHTCDGFVGLQVRGKQVIVTRVDEGEHNGGWGQHLALKWSVRNSGVLHVGRNDGAAPLVIHLPAERIAVSNVPINQQEKDWMDRFDVSVSRCTPSLCYVGSVVDCCSRVFLHGFCVQVQGTQLTITRVDQPGGWTQELQLEYFGEPKYPLP
eukprot:m.336714 g.336714  ORF g.336714 m.336714 type:complete len:192 (+) comp16529_c0_seq155:1012-1587(+)